MLLVTKQIIGVVVRLQNPKFKQRCDSLQRLSASLRSNQRLQQDERVSLVHSLQTSLPPQGHTGVASDVDGGR